MSNPSCFLGNGAYRFWFQGHTLSPRHTGFLFVACPYDNSLCLASLLFGIRQQHLSSAYLYGHPWWNITAISPQGLHQLVMLYDDREQSYNPTIDYPCPIGDCKDYQLEIEGGYALARTACPACEAHAKAVATWLHTALRMLRRDFATSSTPKPFPTGEHVATEKKLAPRQHGKGKPKERTVEHRRPYTIVAYDVSVAESRPASIPTREEDKRQSWLSLHGQEHRIYELRAVPTHERHYRGPHWDRLIARCLEHVHNGESGKIEMDGVIYQVDISLGGEVTVRRTIEIPNGRYVPLLRPEYKKQPTIKKTTAKRFETPEE